MKNRRPTICFDSAVCINRSRGTYPDSEWRCVWKFVVGNYDYAIIPLVLTELMLGIAGGDEAHFESNRGAVKVLYPTHKKVFLSTPGVFVVEAALGRRLNGKFLSPDAYQEQASILMQAQSYDSLISGRVVMPRSGFSGGIDFSLLSNQMESGQKDHIAALKRLRAGELATPSASEWARGLMLTLGLTATPAECTNVAGALDAAFRYDCFLWDHAARGQYDFDKHKSDWIDSQLLYYLADPTIHVLVHDRQLRLRIADSPQSNRVLDYNEFAKAAAP